MRDAALRSDATANVALDNASIHQVTSVSRA